MRLQTTELIPYTKNYHLPRHLSTLLNTHETLLLKIICLNSYNSGLDYQNSYPLCLPCFLFIPCLRFFPPFSLLTYAFPLSFSSLSSFLVSLTLPQAQTQKRSPGSSSSQGSRIIKKAATYSPTLHCSTIGASGLNFSVRNGKRWDPAAITT